MDKKNLFRISEVAKMFHLSASTLRHYENIGLLSPAYVAPESGYRYYSTEQFEILNTVRYLRALDMPLCEIEHFLKNRDIDGMEEMLCQQRAAVIQKQQELKRIEQKIERRLNWLQGCTACGVGSGDTDATSGDPGSYGWRIPEVAGIS